MEHSCCFGASHVGSPPQLKHVTVGSQARDFNFSQHALPHITHPRRANQRKPKAKPKLLQRSPTQQNQTVQLYPVQRSPAQPSPPESAQVSPAVTKPIQFNNPNHPDPRRINPMHRTLPKRIQFDPPESIRSDPPRPILANRIQP